MDTFTEIDRNCLNYAAINKRGGPFYVSWSPGSHSPCSILILVPFCLTFFRVTRYSPFPPHSILAAFPQPHLPTSTAHRLMCADDGSQNMTLRALVQYLTYSFLLVRANLHVQFFLNSGLLPIRTSRESRLFKLQDAHLSTGEPAGCVVLAPFRPTLGSILTLLPSCTPADAHAPNSMCCILFVSPSPSCSMYV
jgi:hypothetical protein